MSPPGSSALPPRRGGLDHRRDRISEKRRALGRGGAPVLGPAGPDGPLSDCRQPAPRRRTPLAFRLYWPPEWTDEPVRCQAAGVPADPSFPPNWPLALALIEPAWQGASTSPRWGGPMPLRARGPPSGKPGKHASWLRLSASAQRGPAGRSRPAKRSRPATAGAVPPNGCASATRSWGR
jgi:hypothetical protein